MASPVAYVASLPGSLLIATVDTAGGGSSRLTATVYVREALVPWLTVAVISLRPGLSATWCPVVTESESAGSTVTETPASTPTDTVVAERLAGASAV